METKKGFKSGFVSIIGRPNVGKSTLLNYIVGQKIAIMSDKPQTTRNKIQGVYTDEDVQIIFIDTPGIHRPKHKLGDFMMKVAKSTLKEVDVILYVIDASEKFGPGEQYIIERLQEVDTPTILVINKIDKISPEDLLLIIDVYRQKMDFSEIVPVSALQGNNVQTLVEQIVKYLPYGPQYYPSDQVTDHPERFIVSELIREKIFHLTREEIPHSIAVVVEQMKKRENSGTVYILASIIVERDSQKGIIIGKNGTMLKQIGKLARHDIEALLGSKVFLELWVKVEKDWRNRLANLRDYGYREDEY